MNPAGPNKSKIEISKTIRSRRRSIALEVTHAGKLVVRAPHHVGESVIRQMVDRKREWVIRKIAEAVNRAKRFPSSDYSPEEVRRYRAEAQDYFERFCGAARERMGADFKSIRISGAQTLWGSCGSNRRLSFNWKLMLAPEAVREYVAIHELCHLTHRNHSARFWDHVAKFLPGYEEPERWLKEHAFLLRR